MIPGRPVAEWFGLTNEARKTRGVSRLARVQLTLPLPTLSTAGASGLRPGRFEAAKRMARYRGHRAEEGNTAEVRIPGEHCGARRCNSRPGP
jgi:hypothetical protein